MPLMNPPVVRPVSTESATSESPKWGPVLTLAFFGLLWWEVIQQLKADWSLNTQYGYGWSVPVLALYLFWKRWQTLPLPVAPGPSFLPFLLMLFCVLLIFPVRFVAV